MPKVLIAPDKIAHIAVFGLIATLIYRALPQVETGTAGNGQADGTVDCGAGATVRTGTPIADANRTADIVRAADAAGTANSTTQNGICAALASSAHLRSLIAIGLTVAFGMSDEIHQSFNPSRTFDMYDFAADAIGAVLAVCAYRWLPVYRRALETPLLKPGRCRAPQANRQ